MHCSSCTNQHVFSHLYHPPVAYGCFEIGKNAYEQQDFYHQLLWMEAALNRLEEEKEATVDKALVLDYYSYALNKVSMRCLLPVQSAVCAVRRLCYPLPVLSDACAVRCLCGPLPVLFS